MAKQRPGGLGRGLGSLIPSESTEVAGPLRDIPVGSIVPNTYQPRRTFDEEALVALTGSIRELGVLQPILVRELDGGQFELIAGERRWRAATRAGLDRIPAIVRDVDDETSLAHAIVENVQRAELNAIEEAAAFQQLIDEFDLTQEDVATRVGRSRPAIANALRLLTLPTDIQRHIIEGQLSAGHGRVLVALDDTARADLLERTLREGLSVRALERLARGDEQSETVPEEPSAPAAEDEASDDDAASGTSSPGQTKPPALLELEQLLGERFDTSVGISLGAKRGRISIDFADIDDLERIYGIMTGDAG
ncbi:MAG: ParB/RepB/Spo0J family partition protein [Actinomycetota bacterium]